MLKKEDILVCVWGILDTKHRVYWKEHGCFYEKTIGKNFEKINVIHTGVNDYYTHYLLCIYKDFTE